MAGEGCREDSAEVIMASGSIEGDERDVLDATCTDCNGCV